MALEQSSAASFGLDLEAAISLRDTAYSRRLDEEFVSNGGRIAFSVDSAILNQLFLEHSKTPSRPANGKSPGLRRGEDERLAPVNRQYQIFRGPYQPPEPAPAEDPVIAAPVRESLLDAQSKLRRILIWYLLEGGSPGGQSVANKLLLLPGHTIEVRKLYDGIVTQFERQKLRFVSLRSQASRISELVRNGNLEDHRNENREVLMRTLSELAVSISDPHDKFDRLNGLLQRRQVLSLRAAEQDDQFDFEEFGVEGQHVFTTLGKVSRDDDDDDGSWSWWNNELHGRLPSIYATLDRDALSTLDRINRALDPAKARVVLFTDNTEIIEAGRLYRPFADRNDGLEKLSFADLYLRHPSSLLVDRNFFRPNLEEEEEGPVTTQEVDGWLDALLDETLEPPDLESNAGHVAPAADDQATLDRWLAFRSGLGDLRDRIGDLDRLEKVLQRNPDIHQRFTTKWTDYLNSLGSQYLISAPVVGDRLRQLVEFFEPETANGVEAFVGQVKRELTHLTEKSWSTFFNTAADTGLELIALPSLNAQPTIWPVPALFIRGNTELCEIVRAFWHPTGLRQDPRTILQRLNDPEFKATLPRSYVHALCYGLLFAHADRWPITRLLAQRGLQIARQLEAEQGMPLLQIEDDQKAVGDVRVSGREASYLLAVASRILSREPDDLIDARAALQASICAQEDCADDLESGGAQLTGIRFEAEGIAISMAEAMLQSTGPDEELAARVQALRNQIILDMGRTGECLEPDVRAHARIALRAEYFFSLLLTERSPSQNPLPKELSDQVEFYLLAQIDDIKSIYGRLEDAPLREQALLRLAASSRQQMTLLPERLQVTSLVQDREEPATGMRRIDRRQLVAIERQIARVETLVTSNP